MWRAKRMQRYLLARKEQLRSDPNILLRDHDEHLKLVPLRTGEPGERKSVLHEFACEPRVPPYGGHHEEFWLAVQFAYDHWDRLLTYPRDVKNAAQSQREILEKEEAMRKAVAALKSEHGPHRLTEK